MFGKIMGFFSSDEDPSDKKLEKGENFDHVKDLKLVIHEIITIRKLNHIMVEGVEVTLPLPETSLLDDQTDLVCQYLFPSYKSDGISVNEARAYLAYVAGFVGSASLPKFLESLPGKNEFKSKFNQGIKERKESGEEDLNIWDFALGLGTPSLWMKLADKFDGDPLFKTFAKNDVDVIIDKMQTGLNEIAEIHKINEFELDGLVCKFPLQINGKLDDQTHLAAVKFVSNYKNTGNITVNEVREKLAHYAGYFDSSFPNSLVKIKDSDKFQNIFKQGVRMQIESKIEQDKLSILNEILIAYEALGAESIKIHELKHIDASLNGGAHGVDVGVNASHEKQVLTEKRFGRGVFDPERALKNAKHIIELPNVMRIIEGRIHGNQTYEKFEETVSFGAGLSIKNAAMSSGASFNSKHTWLFEIQFYDKINK